MSTTVDNRVVEMRFDNRHFENNVKTSISTLDRLKQSLNLSGASKGLDNVNSAAKRFDISPMSAGIETVKAKFSALEVMGVTALANITNSAVNAGKRMVAALTIDPIKTGFSEYETQINAVQTILANTESKGTTLDQVNEALETLNTYADKTIYNFTEMTRNIGTFTAAGVDLDTSVNAIQGIANLAAVSGSTSQQASTAMYQLSQALASGTVKLMDWNSVVNAGMGGEVFQNALKETARIHGVAIDSMIEEQGSFRETLSEGWLTSEILTETLEKFTMATEGATEAEIEANREKLRGLGYTEEQIEGIFKLGNTSTNAATKVKTFTQLWDVLKESAQSGWSKTWKLIIGDFEDAKNLLTPLADFLTGAINKISDFRNNLLESALGKGFTKVIEGVNDAFSNTKKSIDGVLEPVKAASDALEDLGTIVDKVIVGDFGNGQERIDALTKAGQNYYKVQNKVNETLGNSFRYTDAQIEAQDKLLGKQGKATEKTEDQGKAVTKLDDAMKEELKTLASMTEEQARSKGYTEQQIQAIKDLGDQAKKLGIPLNEFIDNLDQINGRWLLINSFKNIGKGIVSVFQSMAKAWGAIFDPITSDHLFNAIAGFHKLTSYLLVDDEAAGKLQRTFKGVFAVIDIVLKIIGGPAKIIFKALTQLLSVFDIDILDLTASIGDAIVKFNDWLDSVLDFTKVFEFLKPYIVDAGDALSSFFDNFRSMESFTAMIKRFGNTIWSYLSQFDSFKNLAKIIGPAIDAIGKWFEGLKEADNIPQYIISGLINGIKNGIPLVASAFMEFAKGIIEIICDVLGIHSPSTVMIAIGGFIVAGLIQGLTSGTDMFTVAKDWLSGLLDGTVFIGESLWNIFKGALGKIVELFQTADLGTLFAVGASSGLIIGLIKMGNALSRLIEPFDGLGDMFDSVSEGITRFSKALSLNLKAKALQTIAISIGILAASVAVLALLDPKKVWNAFAVLAAITALLITLTYVVGKVGAGAEKDIAKLSFILLAVGASLLIIAGAMKMVESIDPEKGQQVFWGMVGVVAALVGIMAAFNLLPKRGAKAISSAGTTLLLIAGTMLLMTYVIKQIAEIKDGDLIKGMVVIVLFGGIITGLIAATKLAGNKIDQVGKTILSIAGAMALMAITVKIISGMSGSELKKGLLVIGTFALIIVGLIAATKLAGKDLSRVGPTILGIGAAILLMALATKIIGTMEPAEMTKGLIAVGLFSAIIVGLIAATRLAGGNDLKGVGATLLLISISIGILAAVAMILSLMDFEGLMKGVAVVGVLALIMSMMIVATKFANDCKGNLIVLTVAIATLAGAIAILSLIGKDNMTGLIAATGAMAILMGMFAILIKVAGSAKSAMGTLIVLAVVVALLGGILWALGTMPDPSGVALAAVALGVLMIAMSGVVAILSAIGTGAVKALVGVIALTALALPLFVFVAVLQTMNGVQNAMDNVMALIVLTGALTLLLLPLALVGLLAPVVAPGIIALLAMAVPLLAFVGILALMEGLQNAQANVMLLVGLLTTMTGVLVVLAAIGPLALIGVGAMAALVALIGAVGVMATAIGGLMTLCPELETFLDKGIPIMEKLAYAIGSFVGNLIAGFIGGVADSLPKLGLALSAFMINAMPFIVGIKMVDEKVLAGVGILAASVLALTAADLIAGVGAFLSGGKSFASLGTELSMFMLNAMPFIMSAKLIDASVVDSIKSLAEAILVLTGANLLESLTSWLTGGSSLAAFGTELASFGPGIAKFAESVSSLTDDSLNAMKISAEAGKTLAEMAATIPNSGGLLGDIFGENDAGTFGENLKGLGNGLKAYGEAVTDLNTDAIKASVPAAKSLVEIADSLPDSGGWFGAIFGENDMDDFGTKLTSFGKSLKAYGESVVDLKTEAIANSVTATKSLVEVADALPDTGGWVATFAGDNDIATFGQHLVSFGKSLADYSAYAVDVNSLAISNTATATAKIVEIANMLPDCDGVVSWFAGDNTLDKFGTHLVSFGSSLVDFSNVLIGVSYSQIDGAVDAVDKIVAMAKGMSGLDFSGMASLGDNVSNIGRTCVEQLISALDGSVEDMYEAASNVMKYMINGISDQTDDVSDAIACVVKDMGSAIISYYTFFYTYGGYLVDGFANGISANSFKAAAKAKAMAEAALEAAREALDSHSPSRETYKLGTYFDDGFENAIADGTKSIFRTSARIGETAKNGLSKAIAKISDVINSDIDAQPTIRPVLDLSDVQAGVGSMNGMFGLRPSVGVLANVGSIGSMMNNNQNGGNDDVVSAIKALRGDIANMPRNNYVIDGITYDDGSNVSDAVSTLVRAVRVGRRT